MASSPMITPILLLRANIDYLSCFITIIISIAYILKILRRKTLRTLRNCLIINSSLNLICCCITVLISVTLTVHYSISSHINLRLCRIIGYLMNSFFYGVTYSYVLLSINVLHSNKYHLSRTLIFIEIILQWLLAFMIPLFINRIEFQMKGRFCYTRQISLMIWNIVTGLFLPIIFHLIFNLITYLHVHKLRTNVDVIQQRKSSPFHQISSRLHRRQNEKHIKLLRQAIAFFIVFFLGWGVSVLVIIFDRYQIIADDIYLIIFSFPSVSILFLTLFIKYWNRPTNKSLFMSNIRNSLSATTIRFSHVQ